MPRQTARELKRDMVVFRLRKISTPAVVNDYGLNAHVLRYGA